MEPLLGQTSPFLCPRAREVLQHLPKKANSPLPGLILFFTVSWMLHFYAAIPKLPWRAEGKDCGLLFNLFHKALWMTALCQSVSVLQNLWLFQSRTGFSTKQIFSQVTKEKKIGFSKNNSFFEFLQMEFGRPAEPSNLKPWDKGKGNGFM